MVGFFFFYELTTRVPLRGWLEVGGEEGGLGGPSDLGPGTRIGGHKAPAVNESACEGVGGGDFQLGVFEARTKGGGGGNLSIKPSRTSGGCWVTREGPKRHGNSLEVAGGGVQKHDGTN